MQFVLVLPSTDRIKHFRHPKGGSSHYEPETEEHLRGKKVLMDIAKRLNLSAKAEVKIGRHVTDVLIDGKQPLAIEFQCSLCNTKEIGERILIYWENGIATLWILSEKFHVSSNRKTSIQREIEKFQHVIYCKGSVFGSVRH